VGIAVVDALMLAALGTAIVVARKIGPRAAP
jgi:hypothetical protein